jgi:putative hemolysin
VRLPMSDDSELTNDDFSYAEPDDPKLRRFLIHAVERATGQPYFRWLYEQYLHHALPGETVWEAGVRLLEVNLVCDAGKLALWPKTGPLVVVCNHPFGVVDGALAAAIVGRVRPDFKALGNAVVCRSKVLRANLFPIDFTETKEAMRTNLKSRQLAKDHVAAGGCLLIFPSGTVSTTPKWWQKTAVDCDWKTFTAGIVSKTHAAVAPLYFAGQNSRAFQLVSHVSTTLRLALLFHEVHNKIGSEVRAGIGDVIPYERLAAITDRIALMRTLREATYALAAQTGQPAKGHAKRPRGTPPPGTPVPGLG